MSSSRPPPLFKGRSQQQLKHSPEAHPHKHKHPQPHSISAILFQASHTDSINFESGTQTLLLLLVGSGIPFQQVKQMQKVPFPSTVGFGFIWHPQPPRGPFLLVLLCKHNLSISPQQQKEQGSQEGEGRVHGVRIYFLGTLESIPSSHRAAAYRLLLAWLLPLSSFLEVFQAAPYMSSSSSKPGHVFFLL